MPTPLLIGTLVIGSTAIFVWCFQNWRRGIILIFIWLYLEDVVRRLTPEQPPEWKLVADTLVLLTYLSFLARFLMRPHSFSWKPPFLGVLGIFVGTFLIGAINPNSPGVLAVLIGFRSYLWYIPLAFLGYFMFESVRALETFCRVVVYSSIFLTFFAILQYFFFDFDFPLIRPLEGGIPYHSFEFVDGAGIPFITSVFGSAVRYALFSLFLFLLGLALWRAEENHRRGKKVLRVAIVSAAIGIVISGSRTAVYLLPLAFGWYVVASRTRIRKNNGFLMRRFMPRLSFISSVVVGSLLVVMSVAPELRAWIVFSIPHIFERLFVWAPSDIAAAAKYAGPFGFGAGAFSQGMQYLPFGEEWMDYHRSFTVREVAGGESWFMESGVAKLLYEFGVLGIGFYVLMVQVLLACKKQASSHVIPLEQGLATATYVFLGLLLIWFSFVHHQVLGDTTTLIPLWFFIGVTFRRRGEQMAAPTIPSLVRAR